MTLQRRSATAPPERRHSPFDTSFGILLAIACVSGLAVAMQSGPMRVIGIVLEYLGILALISPKILCGFFIAAAVPVLAPREVLSSWLGADSGNRGLLVATLAGALVPGGPMMIFPLAVGLRSAGASVAVLVAFITAWSLLGVNRTVIWEMSFIPIDFVALRVVVSMPFPFLAGWVAARVIK